MRVHENAAEELRRELKRSEDELAAATALNEENGGTIARLTEAKSALEVEVRRYDGEVTAATGKSAELDARRELMRVQRMFRLTEHEEVMEANRALKRAEGLSELHAASTGVAKVGKGERPATEIKADAARQRKCRQKNGAFKPCKHSRGSASA